MFCMNCGKMLPDGAKFCVFCGTSQDVVVPTTPSNSETINLNGAHTFVPAMCPNCNAHMKVDSSSKIARCDNCGTECLVQDAIKALTVRGNVQVANATINVNGTNTESLLKRVEIMLADGDFSGAMKKCDTLLDSEPTNGKVYFYMLLADFECRTGSELASKYSSFEENQYFVKALQYGDDILKLELQGYIDVVNARIRNSDNSVRDVAIGDIFGRDFGKSDEYDLFKDNKCDLFIGNNDGFTDNLNDNTLCVQCPTCGAMTPINGQTGKCIYCYSTIMNNPFE